MSIRFLRALKPDIPVLVRLYQQDDTYKWSLRRRLEDEGIRCAFDDLTKRFDVLLDECLLYVTDHFGTTYLEALARNKPTVIVMDRNIAYYRESAEPYYAMLEKASILHYSPKSAAEHINTVYRSLDDWWQKEDVQRARTEFIAQFARGSDRWINDWAGEFNRVLAVQEA